MKSLRPIEYKDCKYFNHRIFTRKMDDGSVLYSISGEFVNLCNVRDDNNGHKLNNLNHAINQSKITINQLLNLKK